MEREWKSTEWSAHTAGNVIHTATVTTAHRLWFVLQLQEHQIKMNSDFKMENILLCATFIHKHFLYSRILYSFSQCKFPYIIVTALGPSPVGFAQKHQGLPDRNDEVPFGNIFYLYHTADLKRLCSLSCSTLTGELL